MCVLFVSGCGLATKTPVPYQPRPTISEPTITPKPTRLPVKAVSTEQVTLECAETTGTIEQGSVENGLPDKPMRYKVYLPPCYSFDPSQRYPVVYLLHGQNSTEEQWIRIGAVSAADQIIVQEQYLPFIIVFPFDYSFKQPREYNFEDVFINTLIPTIDTVYRTQANASGRSIGGLSRGGAWALRLGTLYPDMFGAIGGHSPAIFFADDHALKRRLLTDVRDKLPHLWLDVGTNDSEYALILSFDKFLSDNNIPHEYHEYAGWHDEKYWSAHVKEYLLWYVQNWK